MAIQRDALVVLGTTGLKQSRGRVQEEILPELQGEKWQRALIEMVTGDPIIGGILFAVEMLVRQVTWDFQPADDSNAALEMADWYRGALFEDMSASWEETLAEWLTFLPWGWQASEIVYKLRLGESLDSTRNSQFTDGKYGWRKFAPRAQETLDHWDFDPADGGLQALVQKDPNTRKLRPPIPITKLLLFRTTSRKNNPEGVSILRQVYDSWYYKRNITKIEAVGIERDLAGIPVARVPESLLSDEATESERQLFDAIKAMLQAVHRDDQEGIIFPLAYDENGKEKFGISLMSTGGQRQINTTEVINRHKADMQGAVLADFMQLGHQQVGSYALAQQKTDLFLVAIGAWVQSMLGVFNTHAMKRIHRLNLFPRELMPALTASDITQIDPKELAALLESLAKSESVWRQNSRLLNAILAKADLPELAEGEAAAAAPVPIRQSPAAAQTAREPIVARPPAGAQRVLLMRAGEDFVDDGVVLRADGVPVRSLREWRPCLRVDPGDGTTPHLFRLGDEPLQEGEQRGALRIAFPAAYVDALPDTASWELHATPPGSLLPQRVLLGPVIVERDEEAG